MELAPQDWITIGQVVVVVLSCQETLAFVFTRQVRKVRIDLEIVAVKWIIGTSFGRDNMYGIGEGSGEHLVGIICGSQVCDTYSCFVS